MPTPDGGSQAEKASAWLREGSTHANHTRAKLDALDRAVARALGVEVIPNPDEGGLLEADTNTPFNPTGDSARVFSLMCQFALCGWAVRARRGVWSLVLLGVAIAMVITLSVSRLNAGMLWAFAPDVALVVAAALLLLCVPAALRAGPWARRAVAGCRP